MKTSSGPAWEEPQRFALDLARFAHSVAAATAAAST